MASNIPQAFPEISRKTIRTLLKAYPDAKKLGQHSLATLPVVAMRREREAFSDDLVGNGLALRKLVEAAIQQVKPSDDEPDYARPQWRSYAILHDQFLQKRQAKALRDMLGISESGYFVDQRRGFDMLANILHEWQVEDGDRPVSPVAEKGSVGQAPPLPTQPTPFIGRKSELDDCTTLLETTRLLTLVGPGGIGKTRLSIALAERLHDRFAAGVYFVPLAPINSAETLIPTIADALGLQFDSRDSVKDQLHNFLRQKQLLLVLDNFEHLVSAAPLVAELLATTRHVRIITTSREQLGLRGEQAYPIAGLEIPNPSDPLVGHSAIDLFMDAAKRANPAFTFDEAVDRSAMVQICRLVNGLPLGLELAASWVTMMPLADIADEILQNLDFLGGSFRDAPDRHQSLRAVFEHSWQLLSNEEKAIFSRLASFANSVSRTGARAVAGANVGHLFALQRKSLLIAEPNGLYAIHNLLRQFAHDKLKQDSAEHDSTHHAHCDYFVGMLAEQARALRSGDQPAAIRAVQHAFEDILNAARWAITHGRMADVNVLVPQLHLAYEMSRRYAEGAETFRELANYWRAKQQRSEAQTLNFGLSLGLQARCLYKLDELPQAIKLFDQSLAMLERLGDKGKHALMTIGLYAIQANPATLPSAILYPACLEFFTAEADDWAVGMAHYERGARLYDAPRAESHRESQTLMKLSLQLRLGIGDRWGAAACLHHLGHSSYGLGNYDSAETYTQQSLEIYQDLDYAYGIGDAFNSLGQLAGTKGDYTNAIHYYEKCLDIWRNLGSRWRMAECLDSLGFILLVQGEIDSAESFYLESLAISREIDDGSGTAWSLHNLGDVARQRGDHAQSRKLYMQSIEQHEARDPLNWGRLVSLYKLGLANALLGADSEAEANFKTAFAIAKRTKRYREAIDSLLGLAQLRLKEQNSAEAHRLLAFIINHPATAKETLETAQQLVSHPLPTPASIDLDAFPL